MQYLFAIEKRQFAKPKINMVKDREKPLLQAVFCSLPSLTLCNFYPYFILNGNIKYLLTITKSFSFIYWKINATKFIFPKQTCAVEIEFFPSENLVENFQWNFFYFMKSHTHIFRRAPNEKRWMKEQIKKVELRPTPHVSDVPRMCWKF